MNRISSIMTRFLTCIGVMLLSFGAFITPDRKALADFGDDCADACAFYLPSSPSSWQKCVETCCDMACEDEECYNGCLQSAGCTPLGCNFGCTSRQQPNCGGIDPKLYCLTSSKACETCKCKDYDVLACKCQ